MEATYGGRRLVVLTSLYILNGEQRAEINLDYSGKCGNRRREAVRSIVRDAHYVNRRQAYHMRHD